ncbi:MAG: hypothetical protein MZV63_15985 [Marinilabiliales bacterium]|nr:hypothetical protein [Marinilabiliales bacterium]
MALMGNIPPAGRARVGDAGRCRARGRGAGRRGPGAAPGHPLGRRRHAARRADGQHRRLRARCPRARRAAGPGGAREGPAVTGRDSSLGAPAWRSPWPPPSSLRRDGSPAANRAATPGCAWSPSMMRRCARPTARPLPQSSCRRPRPPGVSSRPNCGAGSAPCSGWRCRSWRRRWLAPSSPAHRRRPARWPASGGLRSTRPGGSRGATSSGTAICGRATGHRHRVGDRGGRAPGRVPPAAPRADAASRSRGWTWSSGRAWRCGC